MEEIHNVPFRRPYNTIRQSVQVSLVMRVGLENKMNKESSLDVIPLKHFWWHRLCLNVAHFFVWIGFLIAVYHALRVADVV